MSDQKKNVKLGKNTLLNLGSNLPNGVDDDDYPQNNTAIGHRSMEKNISGNQNTAKGSLSLLQNKIGSNNTAVGYKSIPNAKGDYNTSLGACSGLTLENGERNTILGKHSDVSSSTAKNRTVIGQGAVGIVDNSITMGNHLVKHVYFGQGVEKSYNKKGEVNNYIKNNNVTLHVGNLQMYDTDGNKTFSLPKNDGKKNQVLKTNGSGKLTWESVQSAGAKSLNDLTDVTLDNNILTFGGSTVSDIYMNSNKSANIHAGGFTMYSGGTSEYSLPSSDGSENQILKTDGSGSLSWTNNLPSLTLGDLNITGNFQYNGTTNVINTTNVHISDNLFGLNRGITAPNSNDSGVLIKKATTDKNAFMGWDATNNKFTMGLTSSESTAVGSLNITPSTLVVDQLEGTIQTASQPNITTLDKVSSIGADVPTSASGAPTVTIGDGSVSTTIAGDLTVMGNTSLGNFSSNVVFDSGATVTGLTKGMVGLGNVDNTADADKNVASAATVSAASQPNITTLGNISSLGSTSGGTLNVYTNGGTNEKIQIKNQQGDKNDSITIESTAGGIKLESGDITNGIKIGTETSGVPITIGHTTSEVTVGDNLNVTGNLTIADGANDFNIASHDGTNGLKLGGTIVTASAAELNILDGVTATAAELNSLSGKIFIDNVNLSLGKHSLENLSTGNNNVAIGTYSLHNNTKGNRNTAIGYETLKSLSVDNKANNNTSVGFNSLKYATTGSDNLGIGAKAGEIITTGINNTLIGSLVNASSSGAQNQIVIGYNATGQANNSVTLGNADVTAVYMAQDSGATVHCGGLNIGNTAVTSSAAELNILDGVTATTTELNLLSGVTSLESGATSLNGLSDILVDGTGSNASIYIGNDPSSSTDNALGNVALGITALDAITTGYKNTAIGQEALSNNNQGRHNTAVGYNSLRDNNGSNNDSTAVGFSALQNVVQSGNTALGAYAGTILTSGWNNVFIGKNAQPSANNGQNQTVLGYNVTGQANNSVTLGNADVTAVYMAQDSGAMVHCGGLNIGGTAITSSAAELNILDGVTSTAAELNILDGVTATTTELNLLSGVTSLESGATSLNGLSDVKVASNSMYVGTDYPTSNTSNVQNSSFGYRALTSLTSGSSNTAIGSSSLQTNTTGSKNTSIGTGSLLNNINGVNNTATGYDSLYNNTSGQRNSAYGNWSLYKNTTGDYNTGIGSYSSWANETGDDNTALGYTSLQSNTGSSNIGLGKGAGYVITSGSNNTIIGTDADPSSATANNQIVIGKGATGQADNSVTLGNADVSAVYMAQDSGATVHCGGLNIGGTAVTSSAAELNLLSGKTSIFQAITGTVSPGNTIPNNIDMAYISSGSEDVTLPTGVTNGKILYIFNESGNNLSFINTSGSNQNLNNNVAATFIYYGKWLKLSAVVNN